MQNEGISIKELGQGNLPLSLSIMATEEAERRMHEAENVNPMNYNSLEYCFNEAYRELKRNHAKITFEKLTKEKLLDSTKGKALIDDYPVFLENNPKLKDTADIKKAFLSQIKDISQLADDIITLNAMEMIVDGKIKHLERTCSHMKKKMDLILKSGISTKLY